jgi:hypothetical protein
MINREKLEDYFYLGTFLIVMLFALMAIFKIYSSIEILAICVFLIRERLIKR